MSKSGFARLCEMGMATLVVVAMLATASRARADADLADEAADADDRWPLAYLQRPMTLLGEMIAVGGTAALVVPDHTDNVDPTTGGAYQFYPAAEAGPFAGVGITDRLELDLFAPRLLCADNGSQPSSCDPHNRFNGTGAGLTFAFLRRARWQGALTAELRTDRSSPTVVEWRTVLAFKLVPWRVFGIWIDGALRRDINPPATQTTVPTMGALNLGFYLQVTERMLLALHLYPWASLGDLGQGIALEVYGEASYTLDHHTQIKIEGGPYNVLANPGWNRNVPEWFTELTFVYWRY